jgi:phosphoribosylamine--glycine ligase
MADQGIHFSGVLYSNIMLTAHGPMVIEHNTRFGDPETQALMLLLQSDLLDLLEFSETQAEVARETLWRPGFAMSLTLASGGYPGDYRKGLPISGLKEANALPGIQVFHAGTALKDGEVVTAGGRVLSIAAQAATLEETAQLAYEAAKLLSFKGMQYRKDIAHRALHGI